MAHRAALGDFFGRMGKSRIPLGSYPSILSSSLSVSTKKECHVTLLGGGPVVYRMRGVRFPYVARGGYVGSIPAGETSKER